ncbi:biotin carboxylase N-terminal domain-containing protein [Actinomadura rayongensis]|uniref:biotin carboxylase n=1 Tax=Actinomadura rayongensis TaxID=1429076 RepID=A0A6I4WCS5_9ACTN|nr:biotin carboxylase N-terminal domain-containing protein [Actinomadura rayongensis]MXQ68017.1 ATP-grasp domain-containing protein [Actinomadura rayongensis]
MLKRILIANRGEIARRVARTCRALGVEFVAVHSAADRGAAHLDGAAETVEIGPAPAAGSYLRIDALLDAAAATGCDAVHPGYGFLSESAEFAAAVTGAGLTWIGPRPETIAALGDKAGARALMAASGVPVLPGTPDASESADELRAAVAAIGYPVILKPVAGGGGKGMVIVERDADLDAAVAGAVRLARAAFGDGRLLAERYVPRPRHVEVQVFGDEHGAVVHLFERECSLQRRHQKIVEEAPAARLPETVRAELLDAAVRGARAVGYVNAGTFEFLLDADDRFYFIEANTRLQVEHPVTEAVTGVDLVEWQLRVAAGEPLPLRQDEIRRHGHAVEARVYAEDPDADFRPAPGTAEVVRWPSGVRVDAAFDERGAVPSFYDPMIAKLVAHGPDRAAALTRLADAARGTAVLGLTTNLGFLADLLAEPRVRSGALDTEVVGEFLAARAGADPVPAAAACAAAIEVRRLTGAARSPWGGAVGPLDRSFLDPAAPLGRVVSRDGPRRLEAVLTGVRAAGPDVAVDVAVAGDRHRVTVTSDGDLFHGRIGAVPWAGLHAPDAVELAVGGVRVRLAPGAAVDGAGDDAAGAVAAPMPGTVVALPVAVGDTVESGQTVAVVEAMKTENRVLAATAGTVGEIRCALGDVVAADQVLVVLEPAD